MAIAKLATNFKDDIIDVTANAHRRYKMTAVSGQANTYTLEDKTTYIQRGTDYNASVVNTTNGTVNSVIDVAESNNANISGMLDGSVAIARALNAQTATSANSANTATSATSAGTATSANTADTATSATSATTADKLTTARNINGVPFDGTNSITVYDDTKLSKNVDFILINQQALNFTNKVCQLNDTRITANTLADVYFTSATQQAALNADVKVETYAGYVRLTATNNPATTLVATIHIRVA